MESVFKGPVILFFIFLLLFDGSPPTATQLVNRNSRDTLEAENKSGRNDLFTLFTPQTSISEQASRGTFRLATTGTTSSERNQYLYRPLLEERSAKLNKSSKYVVRDQNPHDEREGTIPETGQSGGAKTYADDHLSALKEVFSSSSSSLKKFESLYILLRSAVRKYPGADEFSALSQHWTEGKLWSHTPPLSPVVGSVSTMPLEPPAFLDVNMSRLTDCLLHRARLNFTASNGKLTVDARTTPANSSSCCSFQCSVTLQVPPGKLLQLQNLKFPVMSCKSASLVVWDGTGTAKNKHLAPCKELFNPHSSFLLEEYSTFGRVGSDVEFEIRLHEWAQGVSFSIDFKLLSEADIPVVEGAFTSTSEGK